MGELEKDIERSILEYLSWADWFCWKNSTVGTYSIKQKKYFKSRNPFHITGASDIIAIRNGVVLFIEVKTSKGRQTENQKTFEKNIKDNGGIYLIARSINHLKDQLKELL